MLRAWSWLLMNFGFELGLASVGSSPVAKLNGRTVHSVLKGFDLSWHQVLYASSWLLTAFSADFPLFFSARVMDVILSDCYLMPIMKARSRRKAATCYGMCREPC